MSSSEPSPTAPAVAAAAAAPAAPASLAAAAATAAALAANPDASNKPLRYPEVRPDTESDSETCLDCVCSEVHELKVKLGEAYAVIKEQKQKIEADSAKIIYMSGFIESQESKRHKVSHHIGELHTLLHEQVGVYGVTH